MASSRRQGMRKRGKLARARKWLDKQVLKALANPLRNQIVAILNERTASKTELSRELGCDWGEINYEIEALEEAEIVERVSEKKKRGANEVFYRATTRAYLNPSEWREVAGTIKTSMRAGLFMNLWVDAVAAIEEETYDSLEDAHMSWIPMIVDEQGWEALTRLLLRTMKAAEEIQSDSAERLITADAEGISCTVSILGFPSANEKRKVGPPLDAEQLADLAKSGQRKARKAPSKNAATKGAEAGKGSRTGKEKGRRKGKAAPKPKRKDEEK